MATKNSNSLRPAAPQPTKRDRVIAQRQAQVAEGDSILSISNKNNLPAEDLLAANPGVVTVRPGQVINVPKPPVTLGSTAAGNQSGYAMQNQAGVSTTNQTYWLVNSQATQGTAGFWGLFRRPEPKTSGGYMPSPAQNPFAGSGAQAGAMPYFSQPASRTNPLGTVQQNYNPYSSSGAMAGAMPLFNPQSGPFAGAQATAGAMPVFSPGHRPGLTNPNQAPSPYTGYTGTAGYGMQGKPLTPSQANFQTPTTNGFTTPGYTNLTPSQSQNTPRPAPQQPYLGASSYTNPALQPPTSQTQTSSPMMPVDEKGKPIPYTGNPNDPNTALWKKYWDASARAGVDLAGRNLTAPTVMTRDQIWQMKADQRRRQAASTEQDGTAYNQPAYQYDTTGYGVGSPLVRNITWSIRG